MRKNNKSRDVKARKLQDAANQCASSATSLRVPSTLAGDIPKKPFPNKRAASTASINRRWSQSAELVPSTDAQCSKSSSSHTGTSPNKSMSSSSTLVDTPLFSSISLLQQAQEWEAVEIRYIEQDKCAPHQTVRGKNGEEVMKKNTPPLPPAVFSLAVDGGQPNGASQGTQQDPDVKKQTVVVEKLHVRNLLNTIRQQCGDLRTSRLSEYRPSQHNTASAKWSSKLSPNLPADAYIENQTGSIPPDSSLQYNNLDNYDLRGITTMALDDNDCSVNYGDEKEIGYTLSGGFRKNKEKTKNYIYPDHESNYSCFLGGAPVCRGNPDIGDPITESQSQSSHTSSQKRDQATQHDSNLCVCCAESCASQQTSSSQVTDTIVICPKKHLCTQTQVQNSVTRRRPRHAEPETRDPHNMSLANPRESVYSETMGSESLNMKQIPPVLSQEEIDCYKKIALRVLIDRKKLEQNRLKHQRRAAGKVNKVKSGINFDMQDMVQQTKALRPIIKPVRYLRNPNSNLGQLRGRMKNTKSGDVATEEQPTEGSILSAARIKGQIEKHKRRMSQSPKAKGPRPRVQAHKKQQCLPPNRSRFSQRYKNCKVLSGSSQDSLAAEGKSSSLTGKPTKQAHQLSPLSWNVLYALMNKEHRSNIGRSSHVKPDRNALGTKKHKLDKNILMYDEFHQIMLQAAKNIERTRPSLTPNLREKNPGPNTKKLSNAAVGSSHYPYQATGLESATTKPTKAWNCAKLKPEKDTSAYMQKRCTEPPRVTSTFISSFSKKKCASSKTAVTDREKQPGFHRYPSNCGRRESKDKNTCTKDVKQQPQPQQQQPQQERQQKVERKQHLLQREQQFKSNTSGSIPQPPPKQQPPKPVDFFPKDPTLEKPSGGGPTMNLDFSEMLRGILKSPTARATQALGSFQINQATVGNDACKTNQMTVDQILQCYQELFSNTGNKVTNRESHLFTGLKQLHPNGEKEGKSFARPFSSSNNTATQRPPAKPLPCFKKVRSSSTVSAIHNPCHVDEKRHQTRSASVTPGGANDVPGFRRQTQSSLNKINTSSSKPSSPATSTTLSRNSSSERQNIRGKPKSTNIHSNLENVDKTVQGDTGATHLLGDSKPSTENPTVSAVECNSHTLPTVQPIIGGSDYLTLSKHTEESISGNSKIDKNVPVGDKRDDENNPSGNKDSREIVTPNLTGLKMEQTSVTPEPMQESVLYKDTEAAQYLKASIADMIGFPRDYDRPTETNEEHNCSEASPRQSCVAMEDQGSPFTTSSKENKRKASLSVSQPVMVNTDNVLARDKSRTIKRLRVLSETALHSDITKKPPLPMSRKHSYTSCAEYLNRFESSPEPYSHQPKARKKHSQSLVSSSTSGSLASSVSQENRLLNENITRNLEYIEPSKTRPLEPEHQKAHIKEYEGGGSNTGCNSFYAEVSNEPREIVSPSFKRSDNSPIKTATVKAGESLSDSGLWLRYRHLDDTLLSMFKDKLDPHVGLPPLGQPEQKLEQQSLGLGDGSSRVQKHLSVLLDNHDAHVCPIQSRRVLEAKEEQPAVSEILHTRYLNVESDNHVQVSAIRSCGAITKLASLSEGTSVDEDCTSSTLTQKPPVSAGTKTLPPPLPKPRWRRIKKQWDVLESDSADESSQGRPAASNLTRSPRDQLSREFGRSASLGNNSPSTCEENVIKQLQDKTVAKTCEMMLNQHQVSDTMTTTETTEGKLPSCCMFGDLREGNNHSSFHNDIVMTRASPSSSQHSSWVLSSSWEDERRRKDNLSKTSSISATTSSVMTVNAESQDFSSAFYKKDVRESSVRKLDEEKPAKGEDAESQESNFHHELLHPASESTGKTSFSTITTPNYIDGTSSSHDIVEPHFLFKGTKIYSSAAPLNGEAQLDSNIIWKSNKMYQKDDIKDIRRSPMTQKCNEAHTSETPKGRRTTFACRDDLNEPETSDSLEESSTKNTTTDTAECVEKKGPLSLRPKTNVLQDDETCVQEDNAADLKARPLASLEELRLSRVGRSIFAERRRIHQARPCEHSKRLPLHDSPVHVLDDSQEICYVQSQETNSSPSHSLDCRSSLATEPRIAFKNFTLPTVFPPDENGIGPDTKTPNGFSSDHQFRKIGAHSQSCSATKSSYTKPEEAVPVEIHDSQLEPSLKCGNSPISSNNDIEFALEVSHLVTVHTQPPYLANSGSEGNAKPSTPCKTDKEPHSGRSPPKNVLLKVNNHERPTKEIQCTLRSSAPDQFSRKDETQNKPYHPLTLPMAQTHVESSRYQKALPRATEQTTTVLSVAAAQTQTVDLSNTKESFASSTSRKGESLYKEIRGERNNSLQNQGTCQPPAGHIEKAALSNPNHSSPKRILSREKPDASRHIEKKVWENLELFLESVKTELKSGREKTNQDVRELEPCSFSAPPHTVQFTNTARVNVPFIGRDRTDDIEAKTKTKSVLGWHEFSWSFQNGKANGQLASKEVLGKTSYRRTQSADNELNYFSVEESKCHHLSNPLKNLISPISLHLLDETQRLRPESSNYFSALSPPKRLLMPWKSAHSPATDIVSATANTYHPPVSHFKESTASREEEISIPSQPIYNSVLKSTQPRNPFPAGNPFGSSNFLSKSPEQKPSYGASLGTEVCKDHSSCPSKVPTPYWFYSNTKTFSTAGTGTLSEFTTSTAQPILLTHKHPKDLPLPQSTSLQLSEEDINYLIAISDGQEQSHKDDISAILSSGFRDVFQYTKPVDGENLMVFSDTETVFSESSIKEVSDSSDLRNEFKNDNDVQLKSLITKIAPQSSYSTDSLQLLIPPTVLRHSKELVTPCAHFSKTASNFSRERQTKQGSKLEFRSESSTLSIDSSNCISYSRYTNSDNCLMCSKYCATSCKSDTYLKSETNTHYKESNSMKQLEPRKRVRKKSQNSPDTFKPAHSIGQKLLQSFFHNTLEYGGQRETMRSTNVWDTINLLASKMFELVTNGKRSACKATRPKKRRVILKRKGCLKIGKPQAHRICTNNKASIFKRLRDDYDGHHQNDGGFNNSKNEPLDNQRTSKRFLVKQEVNHPCISPCNRATEMPGNIDMLHHDTGTQCSSSIHREMQKPQPRDKDNTSHYSPTGIDSVPQQTTLPKTSETNPGLAIKLCGTNSTKEALNESTKQDLEEIRFVDVMKEDPGGSLEKMLPSGIEKFHSTVSFSKDSEANISINANHRLGDEKEKVFNLSLSSTDTSSDDFDSPYSVLIKRPRDKMTRMQSPVTSCFSSHLSEASEQSKDFSNSSVSFTESSSSSVPLRNYKSLRKKTSDSFCLSPQNKIRAADQEKLEGGEQTNDKMLTVRIPPKETNDAKSVIPSNEANLGVCNFHTDPKTTVKTSCVTELFLPSTEQSRVLPSLPRGIPQTAFESVWLNPHGDIHCRGQMREKACFKPEPDNQPEIAFEKEQSKQYQQSRPPVQNIANQDSGDVKCDKQLEDIPCVKTRGYRALEQWQTNIDDIPPLVSAGPNIENLDHLFLQPVPDLDLFGLSILLLASAEENQIMNSDTLTGKNTQTPQVSHNIVEDFYDERCPPVAVPDSTNASYEIGTKEQIGKRRTRLSFVNRLDSHLPYADFLYPNNVVMYDENCGTETGQFVHPNRNVLFCSGKDIGVGISRRNASPPVVENDSEFVKEFEEVESYWENQEKNNTALKCRPSSPRAFPSNLLNEKFKNFYINSQRPNISNPYSSRREHGKKKSHNPRSYYRRDRQDITKLLSPRMQITSASARLANSLERAYRSTSCESYFTFKSSQRRLYYGTMQGEPMRTSTLLTESAGGLWPAPTSPTTKPRRRGTSLTSTEDFDVDTYRDLGSFITEMEDSSSTGTWEARLARETLCQERRARDYSVTFTNSSSDLISESKLGQCYRPTSSLSTSPIQPMVQINTYVDNCTQVYSAVPEDPAPLRCQGDQTSLTEQMSDKSIQAEPDPNIDRLPDLALGSDKPQLFRDKKSPQTAQADNVEQPGLSNAPGLASGTLAYNVLQDFMKLSLTSFVESLVDTKLKKERNSTGRHDEEVSPNQCADTQTNIANKPSLTKVQKSSSPVLTENAKDLEHKTIGESNLHVDPMKSSTPREPLTENKLCKPLQSVDFPEDLAPQSTAGVRGEETLYPTADKEDCITPVRENRNLDAVVGSIDSTFPANVKTHFTPGHQYLRRRKHTAMSLKESQVFHDGNPFQPNVNLACHFNPDGREARHTNSPHITSPSVRRTARDIGQVKFLTETTSNQLKEEERKSSTTTVLANHVTSLDQSLDLPTTPNQRYRKLSVVHFEPRKSENLQSTPDFDNQSILPQTETPELDSATSKHTVSLTNVKTEETTPPEKDSICEVTTLSSSSSSLVDYGGLKYVLSRESKALWKRLTILESSYENCELCKRQYKNTTGRSLSPQYIRPIRTCQSRPCRLHKPPKTNIRVKSAHLARSSTGLERESLQSKHSLHKRSKSVDLGTINARGQTFVLTNSEDRLGIKTNKVGLGVKKSHVFGLFNHADSENIFSTSIPSITGSALREFRDSSETRSTPYHPRLFLKRKQNLPLAEDGIPPSKKVSQSSCHSSSHRYNVEYPSPRSKVTGGAYRRLGFLRGGKTARMVQLFERSSSSSGRASSYGLHSMRLGSPTSGSSGWSNNASSTQRWDIQEETKLDSVPSSSTVSKRQENHSVSDSVKDITIVDAPLNQTIEDSTKYNHFSNSPMRRSVTENNLEGVILYQNSEPAHRNALPFSNKVRNGSEDAAAGLRDHRQSRCHLSPTSRLKVAAVAEFPLRFESSIENEKRNNITDRRPECAQGLRESLDQEEIIVEDYRPHCRPASPDADQCIKTLGNILSEMRTTFPSERAHQQAKSAPKSDQNTLRLESTLKNPRYRTYSLSPKISKVHNESNSAFLRSFAIDDMATRRRKKPPRRGFSTPTNQAFTTGPFTGEPMTYPELEGMRPQTFLYRSPERENGKELCTALISTVKATPDTVTDTNCVKFDTAQAKDSEAVTKSDLGDMKILDTLARRSQKQVNNCFTKLCANSKELHHFNSSVESGPSKSNGNQFDSMAAAFNPLLSDQGQTCLHGIDKENKIAVPEPLACVSGVGTQHKNINRQTAYVRLGGQRPCSSQNERALKNDNAASDMSLDYSMTLQNRDQDSTKIYDTPTQTSKPNACDMKRTRFKIMNISKNCKSDSTQQCVKPSTYANPNGQAVSKVERSDGISNGFVCATSVDNVLDAKERALQLSQPSTLVCESEQFSGTSTCSTSESERQKSRLDIQSKYLRGSTSYRRNKTLPYSGKESSVPKHHLQKTESAHKFCPPEKAGNHKGPTALPERLPIQIRTFSQGTQQKWGTCRTKTDDPRIAEPTQYVGNDYCKTGNTSTGFGEQDEVNDPVSGGLPYHAHRKQIASIKPALSETLPACYAITESLNIINAPRTNKAQSTHDPSHLHTWLDDAKTKAVRNDFPQSEARSSRNELTDQLYHSSCITANSPVSKPSNFIKGGELLSDEVTPVTVEPLPPDLVEDKLQVLSVTGKPSEPHLAPIEGHKSKGLKWSRLNWNLASMMRTSKQSSSPVGNFDAEEHFKKGTGQSNTTLMTGMCKHPSVKSNFPLVKDDFENGSLVLESKVTENGECNECGRLQPPHTAGSNTPRDLEKTKRKFDFKNILSFRKRNSSRDKRKL